MGRKIVLWKAVVAAFLIGVLATGTTMVLCGRFDPLYAAFEKLREVHQTLGESYLHIDDLEQQQLREGAAAGLVAGTGDRYAAYYSAEDYTYKKQSDKGHLVGIGIEVYPLASGALMVNRVYDDSPAQKSGILPGDSIVAVDGEALTGMNYNEAVERIRGEEGSQVEIEIEQDGVTSTLVMTRADVVVPSVSMEMLDDVAYIQIDDFNTETEKEFTEALQTLKVNNASGILFDLRDNGGGLMNVVGNMLDQLLPEGTICTTVDVSGQEISKTTSDEACVELPMVCLVNENTASAAELFTAALRDFDYAQSAGTNTYGKGVMQTTYTMKDGSAVKFTTAYFNPPSGKNFDGTGIMPDVEIKLNEEQRKTFEKGVVEKDPQLKQALTLFS